MRRFLAWIVTVMIGSLALALSILFALFQSSQAPDTQLAPDRHARPVPHSIENLKDCNQCHLPDKIAPYPADHIGLPEDGCTECHHAP